MELIFYIEQIFELKEAICSTMALVDQEMSQISIDEWKIISQLITVLGPFEELTKVISGEKYLAAR